VNPITGRILWRFRTYNPQLRNDPDGGGEVVNSPVIGPNGTIYFGTWGFGPYETNAFYAVNPDSTLQWRFPADSSLTGRPIFASPAISPDQSTIYFGTFLPDGGSTLIPKLYALNLQLSGAIPDHARVKWELELRNVLFPVYATTLAVGSDGTIYVGGYYPFLLSSIPVIFAIEEVQTPQGIQPRLKWAKPYVELREGAQVGQFIGGIALREEGGQTRRLYVTTSIVRGISTNHLEEGKLYALDPTTGQILAAYDPSNDVPSAVGSLNSPAIGADGVIYFGVRGKFAQGTTQPVNGHVFAVEYDASTMQFHKVWNYEVAGQIDWNHPALGPDGGIYIGSSVGGESDPNKVYEPGEIPPNTTCKFYALKPLLTSVNHEATTPIAFQLEPNYPNPFNPSTTIRFDLPATAQVTLTIFNMFGQSVRTLLDRRFEAGQHQVFWDGLNDSGEKAASGVYFLRMVAAKENKSTAFVQVRKMALVQ
jgi:outer membrane protein assembly factor BamB